MSQNLNVLLPAPPTQARPAKQTTVKRHLRYVTSALLCTKKHYKLVTAVIHVGEIVEASVLFHF